MSIISHYCFFTSELVWWWSTDVNEVWNSILPFLSFFSTSHLDDIGNKLTATRRLVSFRLLSSPTTLRWFTVPCRTIIIRYLVCFSVNIIFPFLRRAYTSDLTDKEKKAEKWRPLMIKVKNSRDGILVVSVQLALHVVLTRWIYLR